MENVIKERPILFSAPMVRALLDGSKTQTRRVVKSDYTMLESRSTTDWANVLAGSCCYASEPTAEQIKQKAYQLAGKMFPFLTQEAGLIAYQCPYGKVGDRLWVRETWMPDPSCDDDAWDDAAISWHEWDGCGMPMRDYPDALKNVSNVIYRASWDGHEMVGWKPSIHMPRWASRITLEITAVKVERLNDISTSDIKSEGIKQRFQNVNDKFTPTILRGQFLELWDSINGAGIWSTNPWVWVVEFKRI